MRVHQSRTLHCRLSPHWALLLSQLPPHQARLHRQRLQEEVRGKEELLSTYSQLADAVDEQRLQVQALREETGGAVTLLRRSDAR